MRPAGQPSSLSNSTPSFKKEFAAPDPADRGACARFRMRRKAFKASSSRHLSPATALQLQTKLEFYQRLNSLNQTVLQQACAFSEHLVSYTSMVNTLANLVRVGPASIHLSQPLHCNEDCAPSGQNSTSPNPASCIPVSHGLLSVPSLYTPLHHLIPRLSLYHSHAIICPRNRFLQHCHDFEVTSTNRPGPREGFN